MEAADAIQRILAFAAVGPRRLIHSSLLGATFRNDDVRCDVVYAHTADPDDFQSRPVSDADADLFLQPLATLIALTLAEGRGTALSPHRLGYLISGELPSGSAEENAAAGHPLKGRRLRLISAYHYFGQGPTPERHSYDCATASEDRRNPFSALFCFFVTRDLGFGQGSTSDEVKVGLVVDRRNSPSPSPPPVPHLRLVLEPRQTKKKKTPERPRRQCTLLPHKKGFR